MATILNWDQQLSTFIAGLFPHNLIFDRFFTFFSLLGGSIWIWLIIIIALVIMEEKKDHFFLFYFAFAFLLTSFLVNIVLKSYFPRQRPYLQYAINQNVCPNNSSFPSGHTAVAFSSAYLLSFFDRKRRKIYYSFAFLIALSRIYLYCHFFLDTVGGAFIGVTISWLVIKLFYRHYKTSRGRP